MVGKGVDGGDIFSSGISWYPNSSWFVVSTHLKNISQNGNLPQIGLKITNI